MFLGGFKHKSETISITRMVLSENSSDLDRVPGTRSIAAEFSECTILDIELQRCENTDFHFHTAPFGNRSHPSAGSSQSASTASTSAEGASSSQQITRLDDDGERDSDDIVP